MNSPLFSTEMINFLFFTLGLIIATIITFCLCSYKGQKVKIKNRLIIVGVLSTGLMLLYILFYTICSATGRSAVEKLLAETIKYKSSAVAVPMLETSKSLAYYQAANALMATKKHLNEFFQIQMNKSSYDVYEWDKTAQEQAKQLMSKKLVTQMVDLLHLGAAINTEPYSSNLTLGIDFPRLFRELNMRRNLYRHLDMKSGTLGLEGKSQAGYQVLLDGLLVAKKFEREPTIIGQWVNIACIAINMKGINSLLEHYGIDDQSAIKLMNALTELNVTNGMDYGLNGEIVIMQKAYQSTIGKAKYQDNLDRVNKKNSYLGRSMKGIIAGPFRYWDFYYYIKTIDQIKLLLAKPYWKISAQVEKIDKNKISAIIYPLTKSICTVDIITLKIARLNSEIHATRLKLALYIYKNRHGDFPDRLSQLAPELIQTIPVDPINGKPFEYHREGEKFFLSCAWLKLDAERRKARASKLIK